MLWKPLLFIHNRADDTKVAERDACPPPPTFLFSKNRKGKQRKKKERVSKQKLLKGFHQGQNVTVSVMVTILFKSI